MAGCSWWAAIAVRMKQDQRRPDTAELYDPASGTWSATGNMLKPHGRLPAHAAARRQGARWGCRRPGPATEDDEVQGAEVYDPATGPGPPRARWSGIGGGTATVLRDGKVLVAGESGTQVYDPASGTWSATGKMITPRHYATATLLPDGKVLVAGGSDAPTNRSDSAELYDPDTGSWTAIANPHARAQGPNRRRCCSDGNVLVAGPRQRTIRNRRGCTTRPPEPGPTLAEATRVRLPNGNAVVGWHCAGGRSL